MKKILTVLVAVITFISFSINVSAIDVPDKTEHEKVMIYIFYQDDSEHSIELIEFMGSIYKDYSDYFDITLFNINTDEESYYLYESICDSLGEEPQYIPLIVIGNDYHLFGFGTDDDSLNVLNAAFSAYQSDEYTDLVDRIIEENESTAVSKTITDACSDVSVKCSGTGGLTESDGLSDIAIISIIVGVSAVVVVICAYVVKSKDKK